MYSYEPIIMSLDSLLNILYQNIFFYYNLISKLLIKNRGILLHWETDIWKLISRLLDKEVLEINLINIFN